MAPECAMWGFDEGGELRKGRQTDDISCRTRLTSKCSLHAEQGRAQTKVELWFSCWDDGSETGRLRLDE